MRKLLLLIILLVISVNSHAQLDRSQGEAPTGGFKIPAVEAPPLPTPLPDNEGLFSDKALPTPEKAPAKLPEPKRKPFSMTTDNGLMTYTLDGFTPKAFQRDKQILEVYKKDQHLGQYMTTGKFVELFARDHEYVDGDKVRVYVNGDVVNFGIGLSSAYTPILVKLKSGFNSIEFEALNQGTSGPNTAELKLFDEDGQLLAHKEWNLLTGAKASIVVVKQ